MKELETILDSFHLEDLSNPIHPSIFDENDEYNMLIVRIPLMIKEGLDVRSFGFILTADSSYYYNREQGEFEKFAERFEGPHELIDKLFDPVLKGFMQYQERIIDMEESLYEDRENVGFMTEWLGLKRDILRIERVLSRTSETIQQMIDAYEEIATFPINHYVDLHEHMDRIVRSAALQLSKLDYLYNFYNVRTNEKMNKMIYLLTIISAVFLPLNLVVGFFGMNTGGLPFSHGDSGTLSAVLLMISLMIMTTAIVMMWRKKVEK